MGRNKFWLLCTYSWKKYARCYIWSSFPTAFKFCLQYTRKAEFRKLCDNLRMHLGQIQRHHNQSTAINLNNPESQSMHLETRLVQLDSAISMELWQVLMFFLSSKSFTTQFVTI